MGLSGTGTNRISLRWLSCSTDTLAHEVGRVAYVYPNRRLSWWSRALAVDYLDKAFCVSHVVYQGCVGTCTERWLVYPSVRTFRSLLRGLWCIFSLVTRGETVSYVCDDRSQCVASASPHPHIPQLSSPGFDRHPFHCQKLCRAFPTTVG